MNKKKQKFLVATFYETVVAVFEREKEISLVSSRFNIHPVDSEMDKVWPLVDTGKDGSFHERRGRKAMNKLLGRLVHD